MQHESPTRTLLQVCTQNNIKNNWECCQEMNMYRELLRMLPHDMYGELRRMLPRVAEYVKRLAENETKRCTIMWLPASVTEKHTEEQKMYSHNTLP